jgi:hypothetical protein
MTLQMIEDCKKLFEEKILLSGDKMLILTFHMQLH